MNRLVLLTLLLAAPALAEETYWVLSSYPEEEMALSEGRRISAETGIEVLKQDIDVEGVPHYRLLTGLSSEESEHADLRDRLRQAGIEDVWMLRDDGSLPAMQTIFTEVDDFFDESELTELDAFIEDFDDSFDDTLGPDVLLDDLTDPTVMGAFVVAGSFQSFEIASSVAGRLEAAVNYGVIMRDAEVGGDLYHRVLIGPIMQSEEADALSSLAVAGVTGGWVLPNVEVSVTQLQSVEVSPGTSDDALSLPAPPHREIPQPVEYGPDDYNLAELKENQGRFSWPDPRKKKKD